MELFFQIIKPKVEADMEKNGYQKKEMYFAVFIKLRKIMKIFLKLNIAVYKLLKITF